MALVEGFFDESYGEPEGRKILCLAGYLMTDRSARRLTREWSAVLREYGLPYFRMSACAHGNEPFDRLSKADRIAVETKMIGLIKRRTIKGMAVTIDIGEFERLMPRSPEVIGGAYTFLANVIIGGVVHWVRTTNYVGDMAYFFESGHASQGEAQRIMDRVFRDKPLKEATRYSAHAFLDKEKSPPTQAADLLAWQWYTDIRHRIEHGKRRKDCAALLEHPHQVVHVSADKMIELSTKWTDINFGLSSDLSRLILGLQPDGQ